MTTIRMPNAFEKILLVMGVAIILIGYALIYKVYKYSPTLTWESLAVVFLWLILIGVIILVAVAENTKEELKTVIENQRKELQMLREDMKRK